MDAVYNGVTFSQIRSWTVAQADVRTFDGLDLLAIEVTCTVVGQYTGNADATARKADIDQLIQKLGERGKDLQIKQDGGTVIFELLASAVHPDGPFATFEIPGSPDPWKSGFNVPFTLTVKARIDPQGTGPILARSESYNTVTDKKGFTRRTIRGQVSVKLGSGGVAAQQTAITPSVPTGYEREVADFTRDNNDLVAEYMFVDVEQADSNPTTAVEARWSVSLSIQNGQENWAISGSLVYAKGKKPREGDIDLLVKKYFPSDASIVTRAPALNPRDNTLTFTVTAVRGYGKGRLMQFQETIAVQVVRSRRVFKSLSKSAPDVRQEPVRPDVTVVQSGSATAQGAIPSFPALFKSAQDLDDYNDALGEITHTPDGKLATAQITWNRRFTLLNALAAGQIGTFASLAASPASIASQHPMANQRAKGTVA